VSYPPKGVREFGQLSVVINYPVHILPPLPTASNQGDQIGRIYAFGRLIM
jgi:hypothetical protein